MPWMNYCKKCKAEVPPGEICPRCGSRLTRSGERYCFGGERLPVTDWFSWNAMLRVGVPGIGLALLATVILEAFTEGAYGVQAVFVQGFFWTLMGTLGMLLLATLCLLMAQGRETVRYVLDAQGAHAFTYLRKPKPWRLYARFTAPQAAKALQADAPDRSAEGLSAVRRADLLWKDTKRVAFWPETHTILFYRPRWWQVLSIRGDEREYAEAVEIVRKRLARNPKALREKKKK